jgi:uncharacterized repeat protein (TIGR01451 family)
VSKTLYIEVRLIGDAIASWFTDTVYQYAPGESSGTVGGEVTGKRAFLKGIYLSLGSGKLIALQQASEAVNLSEKISVFKRVVEAIALPGQEITIEIVVSGTGLNYVIVADPLPEGFTYVDGSFSVFPEGAAAFDADYYRESNGRALGFAIQNLDGTITIRYKLKVPENLAIGQVVTLPPANVTLFYVPTGAEVEPAVSNAPTLMIGVAASFSFSTEFLTRTVLTNGTAIRWGDVLNVSIVVAAQAQLTALVEVYDENMTLIASKKLDLARGWTLVVPSALTTDIAVLEKIIGRKIYVIAKVLHDGRPVAQRTLELQLGEPTARELANMARMIVRFWLLHYGKPWLPEAISEIGTAIYNTWLLLKTRT